MKVLIFYPRPFDNESIGSILIRASSPHRLTPLQLLRGIDRPCKSLKSLIEDILRGKTEDIQQIARIDNWAPPRLQKSIIDSKFFKTWFTHANASLCPQCAKNGWLPHSHDYTFMTACAIHACKLIRSCPLCAQPLRWNRANLNQGSCNHVITDVVPASGLEVEEAKLLSEWIDRAEFNLIDSYLSVRDTLVKRYEILDTHPKRIKALVEGNPHDFVPVLQAILGNLRGIPQRAALAPLLTNCGSRVKMQLESINGNYLRTSAPVYRSEMRNFYLNRFELSATWGLNLITTDHLITQCFPLPQSGKGDIKKIPLSSLVSFYRALAPTLSNPNIGTTLRQISASKKRAIGTLVKDVIRGHIKSTYFDENADIGDLKIDGTHTSVTGMPMNHLSLQETMARLGTYSMAVIECHKRGLLPGIKLHNKNHYAFRIEDIERFTREYIFGSDISGAAEVPIRGISEKLLAAGIQPVSGRVIDGSSVYIFRRKDLAGVDIDAISRNPKYTKHPNRGPKNHHGLDRSQWMTSAEAAAQLGIATQQLYLFVDRKLLEEKIPEYSNSAGRRYFHADAVAKTSIFVKSLIPLREVSKELGLSIRAALQLMESIIGDHPFRLRKIDYIEPGHAQILKDRIADVRR